MLLKASPTSLKVTMFAIEKGSILNLADCLKMEYRLACAALSKTSDFCEGVYKFKTILFKIQQFY